MSDYPASPGPSEPGLEIEATRNFPSWLASEHISLAFTTYQTGKLFLIGVQANGRLSIFERTFNRCMGLYAAPDASHLFMSSLFQLWRFAPTIPHGKAYEGYDRIFIPQVGYTTGDIDIHDISAGPDGNPVFVSTLFSCIGTVSDTHSFVPLWTPPWISRLAAEDRCHLNGLALVDGKPAYVTSVSRSDVVEGWREHRTGGGVLYDIRQEQVLVGGLSMPHSPRLYRDKLWLLDSGTGYFGYVDMQAGKFEPVAFCPGFLRGLAFTGDYAVVSLSLSRHDKTFQGLDLDQNLTSRGAAARCGLLVIDLNTGDITHSFRLGGLVRELYDVVVLPGVTRPMALGFMSDEIKRVISFPPAPTPRDGPG